MQSNFIVGFTKMETNRRYSKKVYLSLYSKRILLSLHNVFPFDYYFKLVLKGQKQGIEYLIYLIYKNKRRRWEGVRLS
jgi:hypothetical protein